MPFEINLIFQVAGVGIIMAMIHTLLKQAGKEEWAHWVGIIGFIVVLIMVASMVGELFQEIRNVFLFQ